MPGHAIRTNLDGYNPLLCCESPRIRPDNPRKQRHVLDQTGTGDTFGSIRPRRRRLSGRCDNPRFKNDYFPISPRSGPRRECGLERRLSR